MTEALGKKLFGRRRLYCQQTLNLLVGVQILPGEKFIDGGMVIRIWNGGPYSEKAGAFEGLWCMDAPQGTQVAWKPETGGWGLEGKSSLGKE